VDVVEYYNEVYGNQELGYLHPNKWSCSILKDVWEMRRKKKPLRGIYPSGYFNEVEIVHPIIYLNSNEKFDEKHY